jgi:hypothetical protein
VRLVLVVLAFALPSTAQAVLVQFERQRLVGMRCRNRSGHGFFLSRGHSFRL